MTENPEASVLTARRAAQHFRLFRANDAYEHLCILTLLPSLAPLHLMLADTPWPHGFGATLTNVGPLSEGFERSVASPLQPRRLRAMGRTVRSISSLSDNHSNSFQVAVRVARHPPGDSTTPECCRPEKRERQCKGLGALGVADIKALDQAVFNSKHVTDHLVREKVPVEVPHHLMDFDNHFPSGALGELDRLDVRIDHRPLT